MLIVRDYFVWIERYIISSCCSFIPPLRREFFLYIFYIILTIWAWNGMVQHDIQNKIESAREMNVKGLFYTMTKPFSVFHQHIHIHMNWLIHYFSFWFLFPFPFCCLFQWSQSERHYCNFFCSLSMILLLFYKIWGFVLGFNSGSFFVW